MAFTQISTKGIKDGTITNADIGASAAIDGSKVSPSFTSDITITNNTPTINFVDNNQNSDFQINVEGGKFTIRDTTNTATRLKIHSNGLFQIQSNKSKCNDLQVDGNLGIGTGSPSELLHINSASTLNGLLISSTNNSTRATMELNGKDSSGNQVELRLGGFGDTSRGEIFTVTNHSLGFATNNAATQMVLNTSGNLGIGLTNPGTKLDVVGAGTFRVANSTSYQGAFNATNQVTTDFQIWVKNNNIALGPSTASDIHFVTQGNGNTRMLVQDNGNVGIGTTSPVSKFDVTDGTTSISFNKTNNTPRIDFKGNNVSDLCQIKAAESSGGGILQLFTKPSGDNPVERLRIDSAGNVGIGTTSPDSKLSLAGTGSDAATRISITDGSGKANVLGRYGNLSLQSDEANAIAGSLMQFKVDGSERMRIDASGRVGIGTTNPDTKLTVATSSGDAFMRCTGGINQGLLLNKSDGTLIGSFASGGALGGGVSDIGLRAETGNNILFSHSTTIRMRIDSSGSVLIATTTSNVNSSNFGIVLGSDGSAGMFKNIGGSGDVFRTGGTQGLLQVNGDGDAFNTNNSYGQISDETLKQDIVDASSQWDDIKNLKVRKFRFKDNPTGVLQIGVVAQEIEKVSAGLVQEDDKGIKSVKYSVLYMKAVKCLQEAIAKIEVLETEVAALKAS